jgi:hypothetical protein
MTTSATLGRDLLDSIHLLSLEKTVNIQGKIAELIGHASEAQKLLGGLDVIGAESAQRELVNVGADLAELRTLLGAEISLRRQREQASDAEHGIKPPKRDAKPLPGESRQQQAERATGAKQDTQLEPVLKEVFG